MSRNGLRQPEDRVTQPKISFIINLHYAFLIVLHGTDTNDAITYISCCIKEKQSWDLFYTIFYWNSRKFINIHYQEYYVFVFVCQCCHLRIDYFAWATPSCHKENDAWTSFT